jgi:hypothetical protein
MAIGKIFRADLHDKFCAILIPCLSHEEHINNYGSVPFRGISRSPFAIFNDSFLLLFFFFVQIKFSSREMQKSEKSKQWKDFSRQYCQMVLIFSDQKSQFGSILEGLAMDDVGIFLRPFGLFTTI